MQAYRQFLAFTPEQNTSKDHIQQHPTYNRLDADNVEKKSVYVTFDSPSDPLDPKNWSTKYKAWVIALLSWLTLSLTFSSSASSAAEQGAIAEFGCSQIAATAMTSSFLVGMGLGAMPSAPLSECE